MVKLVPMKSAAEQIVVQLDDISVLQFDECENAGTMIAWVHIVDVVPLLAMVSGASPWRGRRARTISSMMPSRCSLSSPTDLHVIRC